MSSLSFLYEPNPQDEYEGRLWLTVSNERFSGRGFFWSHRGDLSGFADQLGKYPLDGSDPTEYRAGYNDAQGPDAVLSVSIRPTGSVGDLSVETVVSDLYERDQRLTVSFNTTYFEIAAFRDQLLMFGEGKADEAILSGR